MESNTKTLLIGVPIMLGALLAFLAPFLLGAYLILTLVGLI